MQQRIKAVQSNGGTTPVDSFHRALGSIMIDHCDISRNARGLKQGLEHVQHLERQFHSEVRVPSETNGPNAELEKALRVSDFFGLAQLMLRDALAREESCGAHFREEHQSPEGEALRDDQNFAHIAAWDHNGGKEPIRHCEPLKFTTLKPSTRSYK